MKVSIFQMQNTSRVSHATEPQVLLRPDSGRSRAQTCSSQTQRSWHWGSESARDDTSMTFETKKISYECVPLLPWGPRGCNIYADWFGSFSYFLDGKNFVFFFWVLSNIFLSFLYYWLRFWMHVAFSSLRIYIIHSLETCTSHIKSNKWSDTKKKIYVKWSRVKSIKRPWTRVQITGWTSGKCLHQYSLQKHTAPREHILHT